MYWSTQDDTEQVRKHLIILDGADKQIKRILFLCRNGHILFYFLENSKITDTYGA